jgi:hypothetical protein
MEPQSDLGQYRDVKQEQIVGFDHRATNLIELRADFTDDGFAFKIGNMEPRLQRGKRSGYDDHFPPPGSLPQVLY